LIVLACAMRYAGALYFIAALDGWSIMLWVAGAVLLVGGWPKLRWALPSVVFLWFMVPLPHRYEQEASRPLQAIGTTASCWMLQSLGQPAVPEGNVIYLGEHHLEVAQACSGLRLFMGITALAFAYVLFSRRKWWENGLILLSIVPIALFANALRITTTGLLYTWVSSDAAERFTHDWAGYAMVVQAAIFFWMILWYVQHLFVESVTVDQSDLVLRQAAAG
jgi:exosortase